jgi:tetratricopeptide (TPR) repeat protein/uncharacterized membrane protein
MNETNDAMKPARTRWLVPLLLLAGALVLYGATLSQGIFPGLPAKSLAWHLGLDSAPTLLDSLWGRLVRLCAGLPGGSVALWTGLLSAACGAACTALMASLLMRVRHQIHDAHDPDEVRREGQARVLAGLTAGLFAMVNIPFWILSTRSLPGTFHLLMLLAAAGLFSEFQRTGKPGRLYLLGLLYGVGISEFATFWIFAPFAALLIVRAMLQRAEFSWPVLLRTGLSLIPGLLLYLLNCWRLWSDPAIPLRGFGSPWSVIWFIWRDQWQLIVNAPQTTGFLLVMMLTVVPWGMLFLMRAKRPAWRYSFWQVGLLLVVLAAAVSALYNLPLSPWNYFGMAYVMATPYLILAACAGYVAGEFWVMGQMREHRKAGIGQPLRSAMGILGLAMPLVVVGAGFWNLPVADGRPGGALEAVAGQMLEDLRGRDVLLSDGVLDDSVRLLARKDGRPLQVVTVPQTPSAPYRLYLGQYFSEPRQQSLLQVGFSAFLQDFLASDAGLLRTAAVDLSDPLREYGYLVPDHLVYRAEASSDRFDLPGLIEAQQPFWRRMEALAARPVDKRNPAYGYQKYVLRLASKVANNIGFMQVERGDSAGAVDTFKQSRRLDPENVSALLNLLTLAQANEAPEKAEYQAEWESFKERHVDSRVMWSLSALYGYVHNTAFLVRQGMMWAVSGKPRIAEAELRRASGNQAVNAEVKAFLGRAYLQSGDLQRSAGFYRDVLKENAQDAQALIMLAEMAMRADDYPQAESLLAQAEAAGVPPEKLRFERAMLLCLKGQVEEAVAALNALVQQDKGNARAWALLAMLTGDGRDDATYEKSLKALKNLQGASPDIRLMLAELNMARKKWAEARAELDQVTRMNPRLIRAWEMLVTVDFQERKRELAEDHVRNLLTLDPENFTGNLMLGSFQYSRGQFSLAESSYRSALKVRRDPAAMNDLAYLLMLKGGAGMAEARTLIEEALALQPNNAIYLSTRGELNLREKRYDEAEHDLQQVLAAVPDNAQVLLMSAQLYAARGQKEAALELAETLSPRQGELPAEQQTQLQELIKQMQ